MASAVQAKPWAAEKGTGTPTRWAAAMPPTRQKENRPMEKQKSSRRNRRRFLGVIGASPAMYPEREPGNHSLRRGLVLLAADDRLGFAEDGGTRDGHGEDIVVAGDV